MDPRSFDSITRLFATRRSRRQAMAGAGSGLAALGLLRTASAQDATPVASPEAANQAATELFVQSFDSGSFAPKPGEDGVFVLTLQGEHGRTIAFTDRPQRLVHSIPTQDFLRWTWFYPC